MLHAPGASRRECLNPLINCEDKASQRQPPPPSPKRIPALPPQRALAGRVPVLTLPKSEPKTPPRQDRPPMPSLDQLVTGQRGLIQEVSGGDALGQRLQEMGLLEGEP